MWPRFLGNLVLLLCSTLVGLLVAEIAVRVTWGTPMPEKQPLVRVKADPDLGWVMLPGDVHYTYYNKVRLNSLGFRGAEVERKANNEYRILAIGDSHIYGQGISDSDLLTTKLEAKLNNRGDRCRYRVVNMGVRGYSLNQEYALLKKVGLLLDPDHVVLFFYINDFLQVNIERRYQKYKDMDWYMFDLSAHPNDDEVLRKWDKVQLLRRSALLMLIHDLYRSFISGESIEQQILAGRRTEKISRLIVDAKYYLDKFQALASARGFRLTVVAIPFSRQINHSYENEMYQSTLRTHLNERGIEFINLLPSFQRDYGQNERVPVFPFDGHYDIHGNEVMSSTIAKNYFRCTI